jgi:hypothetical protein
LGELTTETFAFDGGRQVTVCVRPAPVEAVVFAGDGHRVSEWSAFLEAADATSTTIVGRISALASRAGEARAADVFADVTTYLSEVHATRAAVDRARDAMRSTRA